MNFSKKIPQDSSWTFFIFIVRQICDTAITSILYPTGSKINIVNNVRIHLIKCGGKRQSLSSTNGHQLCAEHGWGQTIHTSWHRPPILCRLSRTTVQRLPTNGSSNDRHIEVLPHCCELHRWRIISWRYV